MSYIVYALKKVFLIDDDPIFVFLAQRMLKNIGISLDVHVFPDGEEARIRLDSDIAYPGKLPDIILLDINMPIMDGWQFMEYYLSIRHLISKNIDIYVVSSTISPDDMNRLKQYTFVRDLVIKPLQHDWLTRIIGPIG